MYVPQHFAVDDLAALHGHILATRVANLVTINDGVLTATLLPLLLDPTAGRYGTLVGHLAKANRQWESADTGVEALVVFSGPDAYVSPSAYPSKREHGKVVPTWNYLAVHAYGPLVPVHDNDRKRAIVEHLTTRHESDRDSPWAVTDAPVDYIDSMLAGIVGIEVPISRLVGKAKLSQNRSSADRQGVIDDLERGAFGGDRLIGRAMKAVQEDAGFRHGF